MKRMKTNHPSNRLISFILLAVLAVLCFPVPTSAQSTDSLEQTKPLPGIAIHFETLDLADGLSQNSVNAIAQDSLGFLWFGTEDGLNRYDGYQFKVFYPDPSDLNSISDRWITSLFVDSTGNLWIGTRQGGLNHYDQFTGKFTRYLHNQAQSTSLSSNFVTTIYQDSNGMLWVGTNDGLNIFDPHNRIFIKHNLLSDQTPLSINTILEDSSHRLWVGTDAGLIQFDLATMESVHYTHTANRSMSLSSNIVNTLYEDSSNNLWIGTDEALDKLINIDGLFQHYKYDAGNVYTLSNNIVTTIIEDKYGALWVGTENGLNQFDYQTTKFRHFFPNTLEPDSISNGSIRSIFQDREGIIWVGTFGGGVNKLDTNRMIFNHYRHHPTISSSLSQNIVFGMAQDREGMLWIATYGNGLEKFDPLTGRFRHYRHDDQKPSSLISNQVWSVYVDSLQNIWVGTALGLDRFTSDLNKFTHFVKDPDNPQSLSGTIVYSIYEDSTGIIWVGTDNGLNRLNANTNTFTRYLHEPGNPSSISNDEIVTILEDRSRNFWVGTFNGGLNLLNRATEEFTHFTHQPNNPDSISNNSILCLVQDSRARLWIGTAGGGLNLFLPDSQSFKTYTDKDGLPSNVIYGIVEDYSGSLWISTNNGLSRFNPANNTFENFNTADGLQSNEFNMNAFTKTRDGKVVFGGVNGLNIFDPRQIAQNKSADSHPIVITSFTQNSININTEFSPETTRHLTLTWPQNYFEFEMSLLSYVQPSQNEYAYRLLEFDNEWIEIGSKHFGRYTNLPGGTYTLEIRGTANKKGGNDTGYSVSIKVIPPFWETWWFQGAIGFLLIAGFIVAYTYRLQSIQKRNIELEQLVHERTYKLETRNQEMEALFRADERMHRYLTLDQVLKALVDVAVEILKADKCAVYLWNEQQDLLVTKVANGFSSQSVLNMHFHRTEGLIGKTAQTGEIHYIEDVYNNPEWKAERPEIHQLIRHENIRSFIHIPIQVNEKNIGVFSISFTSPHTYTDEEKRLYTALVQRAILSIENAQLFEQTREIAIIEERGRLARDLHDSAKQKAFAALAQLGAARGIVQTNVPAAQKHMTEAENLVYDVLQEMIFLIQELYPATLKERGLVTALREYIFEWENRNDINIELCIDSYEQLPLEIEQALYRIAQESLANVVRHSHANHVKIMLEYKSSQVMMTVQDNGIGFNPQHKYPGMGLTSMKERSQMIGGTLHITSITGSGTQIQVVIPINGNISR